MRSLCGGLFCAVVAACGGGNGGSGVDEDQTFADITVDERQQICEWYVDTYVDADVLRLACYVAAVNSSDGDPEACDAFAQACLDEETEAELDQQFRDQLDCTISGPSQVPDCASELTVGDFEDCAVGFVGHVEDLGADVSCDTTADDLLQALDIGAVPECAALVEACPDLSDL